MTSSIIKVEFYIMYVLLILYILYNFTYITALMLRQYSKTSTQTFHITKSATGLKIHHDGLFGQTFSLEKTSLSELQKQEICYSLIWHHEPSSYTVQDSTCRNV